MADVINPTFDPNGWWPRLQVFEGRIYLAYGNGQQRIAELRKGDGRHLSVVRDELIPPPIEGSHAWRGQWSQPGILTGFVDTNARPPQARRCLLDVRGPWAFTLQDDDPNLCCGNEMAVTPILWSTWLASGMRIAINGVPSSGAGALSARGRWVAHANDGTHKHVRRHLLGSGTDTHACQNINFHTSAIAENGYTLYGSYGPTWGFKAPGLEEDLTVTPWRVEGIGLCWVGSEGLTWIATTSWHDNWREGGRILIRPWGEKACVQVIANAVSIDIVEDGDDWILAWCGDRGQLEVACVPRNSIRTPVLTPLPPITPPVEPPVIPPEVIKPPAITITSYAPTSGPAPLPVRAVAAIEAASGPVTTLEWLKRKEGSAAWEVDATNPAADLDHTYKFPEGAWLLAVKATGPGGSAQTQTPRKVTATSVVTEPPPIVEPPPVQPPAVDEEFVMGAIVLLAKRLFRNGQGNLPDRYHEKSADGQWIASVDANGNRTAVPGDMVPDANESIEWIEGAPTAYYWPHKAPFDNKILCIVDLSEKRDDQTFKTRKNLQGEK